MILAVCLEEGCASTGGSVGSTVGGAIGTGIGATTDAVVGLTEKTFGLLVKPFQKK